MKEIKDRINYFNLQTDGTYDFPNSKEGDLLKMVNKALTQKSTLIDQQAQELAKLKEELTAIRPLVDLRMHDDKDSLELAVKALEWYAQMEIKCEPKHIDGGKLAQSTLAQIRRTET